MIHLSALGAEREVHCDDNKRSHFRLTRSHFVLQRHLSFLSVEALPVRLEVLH